MDKEYSKENIKSILQEIYFDFADKIMSFDEFLEQYFINE